MYKALRDDQRHIKSRAIDGWTRHPKEYHPEKKRATDLPANCAVDAAGKGIGLVGIHLDLADGSKARLGRVLCRRVERMPGESCLLH